MQNKYLFLASIAIIACSKPKEEKAILPDCIQEKIKNFSNTSCERGASVSQYNLKGENVFVFDFGFCQTRLPSKVYNKNCEYLGEIGGSGGNDKISGVSFDEAVKIGAVWTQGPIK